MKKMLVVTLLMISTIALAAPAMPPIPQPPAPPGIEQGLWNRYWSGDGNSWGIERLTRHYLGFFRHLFGKKDNPYSQNDVLCASMHLTKATLIAVLKNAIAQLPNEAMLHSQLRTALASVEDTLKKNGCNDPGNKGKQAIEAATRHEGSTPIVVPKEEMRIAATVPVNKGQIVVLALDPEARANNPRKVTDLEADLITAAFAGSAGVSWPAGTVAPAWTPVAAAGIIAVGFFPETAPVVLPQTLRFTVQ